MITYDEKISLEKNLNLLTTSQKKALETFKAFLERTRKPDNKEKCFILNGEAGTGKTWLLKYFALYLQNEGLSTSFISYTGKAASRLRESTGLPATTIHKLIYMFSIEAEFFENSEEEKKAFEENKILNLVLKSKVLVIDEYSMLSEKLIRDLLKLDKLLIFAGDLNQLPPVKELMITQDKFSELVGYDVECTTLTEPVRQSLHNPILKFARLWKQYNMVLSPKNEVYNNLSLVIDETKNLKLNPKDYLNTDHVMICYSNEDRHKLNTAVRSRAGFKDILVEGEKIIIMANHKQEKLWNGQMYKVSWVGQPKEQYGLKYCPINIEIEEGDYLFQKHINVWLDPLITNKYEWELEDGKYKKEKYSLLRSLVKISYGYAITCHKAQGSEWPTVYIHGSDYMQDRQRWYYTAITRAKNCCIIKV